MKKLILSLSIASALGLTGCGGGETLAEIKQESEPVVPASRVLYDPANGVLSIPNDLLFSGSPDGTLNLPAEVAALEAGMMVDYTNPENALGAIDGWSTQSPFTIALDFPAGISLDEASAAQPGSVKIYETILGGALSTDEECKAAPNGIPCKPVAELTFGVDFITKASGTSVAVIPLKPLKAATGYIVTLTNQLQDSLGRPLQPSSTYGLVKQDINTKPLVTESQLQLQGAVNNYENLASAMGADKSAIIFSSAMTTQSSVNALATVKQLHAAVPAMMPNVAVANSNASVFDLLAMQGLIDPTAPTSAMFKAAQYYAGTVTAPYYVAAPTPAIDAEGNVTGVNFGEWKGACDNAAVVAGYAAQAGENYPMQPVSENDGYCMAVSGGQLRDFGLDTDRHITKYNAVPKANSYEVLDVQMTVPNEAMMNGIRATLGLPALSMPESGWPVVMMQHGITSKKEDMLALTGALSLQGFATAAIDHPLHGSRGFDFNGDGTDEVNASTVSATHYLNLADLLVGRDNLRQSVSDMLALRLGLNFTAGADVDGSKVFVIGHSLGAISTTKFTSVANMPTGNPQLDYLYKVQAASLGMPGGGIAGLLLESETFGNLVKGSVLLGAGDEVSAALQASFATPSETCAAYAAVSQEAFMSCATAEFLGTAAATGDMATLNQANSTLTSFTFAAQSVIDSADPNNYGSLLAATGTPVHMIEVVGDGMENLGDQVIPNQTMNVPSGGTEPLANTIGLMPVTETVMSADATVSGLVRFSKGHHSSLLDPSPRAGVAADAEMTARATSEMQQQIATYFASGMKMIPVTDKAVISGAQ